MVPTSALWLFLGRWYVEGVWKIHQSRKLDLKVGVSSIGTREPKSTAYGSCDPPGHAPSRLFCSKVQTSSNVRSRK